MDNINPDTTVRDSAEHRDRLAMKFELLSPERLAEALATPDLTAEGSSNAVNVIKQAVIDNLANNGFSNVVEYREDPIVSVVDNFDILRFPSNNAGRSSRYTRYVDSDHVLRTHTSAMVPSALRKLSQAEFDSGEEVTLVMPGLCFRRDVTDKEHLGIFHQMDVWVIRKNGAEGAFDDNDLKRLASAVFEAASPGSEEIIYEADHPYTIHGIEAYSQFKDGSLEIFEAGLAHPEVLESCGLDPNEYSGLALGMGLDRLVMARKSMPDIRLIRAETPEIAVQMTNLEPYVEVERSNQPPILRDMSYAVDADVSEEDISDQLQEAFGDHAYLLEKINIKTITTYEDLHPNARERLGMTPDKVNVLVSIIIRHPDKTLTSAEANELYKMAYGKLHSGNKEGYVIR